VAQLVTRREALARGHGIAVDGDNRSVSEADDVRLASGQRLRNDCRAARIGDRFDIQVLGLGDAEQAENLVRRCPGFNHSAHYYAEVLDYSPFPKSVSYCGLRGKSFEPARTMRNSVRSIEQALFQEILKKAGFGPELNVVLAPETSSLAALYENAKPELRRFLAARYERPNRITKLLKERLGATCQICGVEGFLMRNGKRYCEVHHLFHLAKRLPGSLGLRQLVVVCPTCHRKLHYASTTEPLELSGMWSFELCGEHVLIPVFGFEDEAL